MSRKFYSVKKIIAWNLANVTGVGGIFTVEQIEYWVADAMIIQRRNGSQRAKEGKRVECDRRLRELREVGWVIASHLDMPGLASNQYRLVAIGKRVWETA